MDRSFGTEGSTDWDAVANSLRATGNAVEHAIIRPPREIETEPYWNMWVGFNADGIVSAHPRLQDVMDELSTLNIIDCVTEFIPTPSDSIEI